MSSCVGTGILGCNYDRITCKSSWDFERGALPPRAGFNNRSIDRQRLKIMSGAAFSGDRFGRVTVFPGNEAQIGRDKKKTERAEVSSRDIKSFSGIYHFGVAVRFPVEFRAHEGRTLILQIKTQIDPILKASPQFAIYSSRSTDRWKVCNNIKNLIVCDYRNGRIFQRGKWHKILVSQNASKTSDGWLKLYIDGKLVYYPSGTTQYNARDLYTNFRVGIYRGNVEFSQSLDVDKFIVSISIDSMKDFLSLK